MVIHESISPFGGFAPFPNSIMIPFMATQSAVLGYSFGLGYESGKRTIKAMSNDDFNKFIIKGDTVEFEGDQQSLITIQAKKFWRDQVKLFNNVMPEAIKMQHTIIEQSVTIEKMKATRTPSAVAEIFAAGVKGNTDMKTGQIEDFLNWWKRALGLTNVIPQDTTPPPIIKPPSEGGPTKRPPTIPQDQKAPEPKEPKQERFTLTFEYKWSFKGSPRAKRMTVTNDHDAHIRYILNQRRVLPTKTGSQLQEGLARVSAYTIALRKWEKQTHWH